MATRPVQEQDRRTARPTLALSPREFAAVEQARGEMPRSAWLRDAVMEKLAREGVKVADDARRAAPRRQNHSERQQQQEGQE
jgi:hypothetical protein